MNAIETALYGKLSAATALTTALGGSFIYNRHAPQGQGLPYIVFVHAGGGHENINPSNLQDHVYLIKAVAAASQQAGTLDGLVSAALHGTTLTVSGYTNFWTAREEEVQLTEQGAGGTFVYHCGAYYRIRIDA